MTTLHIRLLGGFHVAVDGHPIAGAAWRHRRAADLTKLLALAPAHRLTRDQLIDALWPELEAEAGGSNLRKAVYHARQALGDNDLISLEAGCVMLSAQEPISTDAAEFEAAAISALDSEDEARCRAAASLYAGDLLPTDPYATWVEPHRERLRARFLSLLRASGQWDRLVHEDPLDEEAHREVMKLYLQTGRRQEAVRLFEALRKALRSELGVGPDPETVQIYADVLAHEGSEPVDPAGRVRALTALALGSLNRMELDQAGTAASEARSLAITLGLGRALGETSAILGLIAHMRGEWRTRFREEFEDVIHSTPDIAGRVFDAHLCFAEFSLHGRDGHATAASFARDLLSAAEESRSLPGRALATLMLGEAELLSGQVDEAEKSISAAIRMHQEAGLRSGYLLSRLRHAEIDVVRGRRAKANRDLIRAVSLARRSALASHLVVHTYGVMLSAAADPRRAVAVIDEAETELETQDVCEPCSMHFRVGAAIALARMGDVERAGVYLDAADRIAGMWRGGGWTAAVWEARALLRLAEGDTSHGAALLAEAADLFKRLGRPLDEGRCRRHRQATRENADGTHGAAPRPTGDGGGRRVRALDRGAREPR